MNGRLYAVAHPGALTASGALAWFDPAGGGRAVIGYLYAADRAEWFRCDGAVAAGPDGPRELRTAYELVATDGTRHLRWRHENAGTGPAVSLSEDRDRLPAGEPLPAEPERTRLDTAARRLLAGKVVRAGDGWATLGSARYARCQVPVTAGLGQEVWADLAEYTVSDEHGNLSVIDTLLLGLRPRAAEKEPGA
jgi:hypothetical protein